MANVMKFYGFEFSSINTTSPELSGAQTCFKYALTVANIIFLIFGAVLCGVGGYAMQTKAGGLAGESLPTGLIVMGVFIILLSFVGCLAAFRESRWGLAIYFGFLLLFTIILFSVGVAVYAKKDQAETYMAQGWCEAIKDTTATAVITDIQTYFMCCGLYVYDDSVPKIDPKTNATIQQSGCSRVFIPWKELTAPIACPAPLVEQHTTAVDGLPCLPQLSATFQNSYVVAGGCAIAFSVIMLVGMIIVCVLMAGIKEKKHLEDIRKLHRKLREAKEDPTHSGLKGMTMEEYNDVDLGTQNSMSRQEPLDHEVNIQMSSGLDQENSTNAASPAGGASSSSSSSSSSFKAQPPVKIKKTAKPAVPEPEEIQYEEEPYEEENTNSGFQPAKDEYDEEE